MSSLNLEYVPEVSIVVPLGSPNEYIWKCVEECRKLDYPNFEILVFPDDDMDLGEGVRVFPTGRIPPSEKRDLVVKYGKGEIIAFIDDDAYPTSSWLREAVKHFKDGDVGGVGGPAVTPEEDNIYQKASGGVYASKVGGGSYTYRYVPGEMMEVDDYPSCNFLVRKSIFESVGGFDTHYWPGEDTKLCLDITKKLGKKIIYEPKALVYHHRRELFKPHLLQVWNYAVHRGFFSKRFPETSRRISYFLPSLFVLGLFLGPLSIFVFPPAHLIYFPVVGFYIVLALASSLNPRNLRLSLLTFSGIVLTHITYGIGFIIGLTKTKLKR